MFKLDLSLDAAPIYTQAGWSTTVECNGGKKR